MIKFLFFFQLLLLLFIFIFFFFNDTATTEIYTLSLHDALPISRRSSSTLRRIVLARWRFRYALPGSFRRDRKSTRLNSSHDQISYAVFCLKKKKKKTKPLTPKTHTSALIHDP